MPEAISLHVLVAQVAAQLRALAPSSTRQVEPGLMPTIVVAPELQIVADENGNQLARFLSVSEQATAIVGQLGIDIGDFPRKNMLRAGRNTQRDSVRLSEATTGALFDIIGKRPMQTESPPTAFGDRLLRAMLSKQFTVEMLVTKSGLSRATVHRYLHCSEPRPRSLQMDTIIALSQALEVDGWWLLTGEGEPPYGHDRSTYHQG